MGVCCRCRIDVSSDVSCLCVASVLYSCHRFILLYLVGGYCSVKRCPFCSVSRCMLLYYRRLLLLYQCVCIAHLMEYCCIVDVYCWRCVHCWRYLRIYVSTEGVRRNCYPLRDTLGRIAQRLDSCDGGPGPGGGHNHRTAVASIRL